MQPRKRERGVPAGAPETPKPEARKPNKKPVTRAFIDETIMCHDHVMVEVEPGLFWCPSQEHDGRPGTHPLGAAPRTPAFRQPGQPM